MNCTHCGATNYLQTATCWRCSQPFVVADEGAEAVTLDRVEPEEAEEVEHIETARAKAVIEGERPQPQPQLALIAEVTTLICNYCGTSIHSAALVCWKCGIETSNYTEEVRAWHEREALDRYIREQVAPPVPSTGRTQESAGTPEKTVSRWRKVAGGTSFILGVVIASIMSCGNKSSPYYVYICLAAVGLVLIGIALDPSWGGGGDGGDFGGGGGDGD